MIIALSTMSFLGYLKHLISATLFRQTRIYNVYNVVKSIEIADTMKKSVDKIFSKNVTFLVTTTGSTGETPVQYDQDDQDDQDSRRDTCCFCYRSPCYEIGDNCLHTLCKDCKEIISKSSRPLSCPKCYTNI